MNYIVHLDDKDTVATSIKELQAGEVITVGDKQISVKECVPFAHKIALTNIKKGEAVYKYGESIGLATADIAEGCLVHVHNIKSNRGLGK